MKQFLIVTLLSPWPRRRTPSWLSREWRSDSTTGYRWLRAQEQQVSNETKLQEQTALIRSRRPY